MSEYNYSGERTKIDIQMIIYLQLVGYFAYTHATDIGVQSEADAKKVTDFLMTTDNPSYWLMVVLCTRGMNADEIIAALKEQEADKL
jgi:hypothetical protein